MNEAAEQFLQDIDHACGYEYLGWHHKDSYCLECHRHQAKKSERPTDLPEIPTKKFGGMIGLLLPILLAHRIWPEEFFVALGRTFKREILPSEYLDLWRRGHLPGSKQGTVLGCLSRAEMVRVLEELFSTGAGIQDKS